MKRCLVPLLMFLAFAGLPVFAQQQGGSFNWSLGLQNVKTSDLVSFSAPVQSSTGEQYRLVINPETSFYCYVIYESPDGNEVTILYAGLMKEGAAWYSPVLELTPPKGAESLFIVASKDEQKNLSQRIAAFRSNSGTPQKRALMNEIFKVRSDASKFKEMPEKPVLMGGASRGNPDKSKGVEFSGLATYVKTISIEH